MVGFKPNKKKRRKKKTNLKYCLLNCQKRTQITFKFAILLFLAAKDGEREREREGKAVMMVHPFNTVKVLFSEKSLRKCFFFFLFRVRLYQVKESHGNEEKSILISMKCVCGSGTEAFAMPQGARTHPAGCLKTPPCSGRLQNSVATPVLSHRKHTFQTSFDKATVFKPQDFSREL